MVAVSTFTPHRRPALRLVPPPQGRPHYRLRRLVVLLALGLVLAAGALVADAAFGALSVTPQGAARSAGADSGTVGEVHVVQPGDTMWSIASEIDPTTDPRSMVDQLVDLNGSASIQVGQRVVLP
ncbi:MAG TPA: LysM peptidoglycan-binding domain-containing protein [Acidimicrobiales bacterium]|nr:LysM peptidoglycan-binding domain-containing protein [Acidimicrobiales bacterium]